MCATSVTEFDASAWEGVWHSGWKFSILVLGHVSHDLQSSSILLQGQVVKISVFEPNNEIAEDNVNEKPGRK